MSFILDALRKSESERQVQTGPGIANVPYTTQSKSSPMWIWGLSALLAINVVVLIVVLFRTDSGPAPIVNTEPNPVAMPARRIQEPAAAAVREENLREEEMLSTAAPQIVAPATRSQQPSPVATEAAVTRPAAQRAPLPTVQSGLKSFNDLRAAGVLDLPELHLDIHVFSEQLDDRFVFVNMTKYKQHARLDEGPVISEITPEGVILEHAGTRFLLPRE